MRIVTTFTNDHVCVCHDTALGGAVLADTGECIASLSDFYRRLHEQRRTHNASKLPYTIRQEIIFDECPARHADAAGFDGRSAHLPDAGTAAVT